MSNVVPWVLHIQRLQLYFFPDRVLIRSGRRFAALSYDALNISTYTAHFVWEGALPNDAQVVGQTWRYVRKDGGPDRRFNGNYQIPVVNTAYLELASATGLRTAVQTTHVAAAGWVERELSSYGREIRTAASPARTELAPEVRAALGIFGLNDIPSVGELKATYRNLAQRNHPDKFVRARRDIRLLAEERMREINEAYALLMDRAGTRSGSEPISGGTAATSSPTTAATPTWRVPEVWAVIAALLASAFVFGAFRHSPAQAEAASTVVTAAEPVPIPPKPITAPPRPTKAVAIACPLRVSPSPKAKRLASIPKGTTVEMLDSSGGWWRVRLGDGAEGWTGPLCWEPTAAKAPAKRRPKPKLHGDGSSATGSEPVPIDPYAQSSPTQSDSANRTIAVPDSLDEGRHAASVSIESSDQPDHLQPE